MKTVNVTGAKSVASALHYKKGELATGVNRVKKIKISFIKIKTEIIDFWTNFAVCLIKRIIPPKIHF